MKDSYTSGLNFLGLVTILFLFSCSSPRISPRRFSEPAAKKAAGPDFILGADSNYALAMEEEGFGWRVGGKEIDLFRKFSGQGVNCLRLRIWTGKDGESGRDYAARTALRARRKGLRSLLVFFLSENWADLFKQPAPSIWRDLSLSERAEAVRCYCRGTARQFRQAGIDTHLYQVGNEIDYGICGVFAKDETDRNNPAWLDENIWKDAALIIRSAQEGIREADPDANFVVHLARWWDPEFCIAFYKAMSTEDVQIDYLGLSYFPTSGLGSDNTLPGLINTINKISQAVEKPVLIAEFAYPSAAEFSGQFSMWNHPVPGYSLTPEGQKEWLKDFLEMCRKHTNIVGAFYWSPEWYDSEMWSAFSLFFNDGRAKPALNVLKLSTVADRK